jgi:hypothetical protein
VDFEEALGRLKKVLYESDYDGAWGDETLVSYLSEGQDRFCEDTGLIIDPNISFQTEAGVDSYALPSYVKRVLDVHINGLPLTQYDAKHGNVTHHHLGTNALTGDVMPAFYRTDWAPGYITLTSTPRDVYTVNLRVWRYPKRTFEDCERFEIPARFHMACIEWAAYKALNHHDMELQDPIKGRDHYGNYMMYVARAKEWLHQLRGQKYELIPNQQYVV